METKIATTVTLIDGRTLDIEMERITHTFVVVDIYRVKRPHRKRFGRHGWAWDFSHTYDIDQFENLDAIAEAAIMDFLVKEQKNAAREKKFAEGLKNY